MKIYFLEYCPEAKIILVGTKKDLKHDTAILNNLKRNSQSPIEPSKAEKLCKDMQAIKYIGEYSVLFFLVLY